MCYPVVLSLRTSWEAFRRDFQQLPRSWTSMTCSDVITWPIIPQQFSLQACILSKGPDIPLFLVHTGQLRLLGEWSYQCGVWVIVVTCVQRTGRGNQSACLVQRNKKAPLQRCAEARTQIFYWQTRTEWRDINCTLGTTQSVRRSKNARNTEDNNQPGDVCDSVLVM